jgi:hypothetical protein
VRLVDAAHAANWMPPAMTDTAIAALAQSLHSADDEVRPLSTALHCAAAPTPSVPSATRSVSSGGIADCAECGCRTAALPTKRRQPLRRAAAGCATEPGRHAGVAVRVACEHVRAAVLRKRAVGAWSQPLGPACCALATLLLAALCGCERCVTTSTGRPHSREIQG